MGIGWLTEIKIAENSALTNIGNYAFRLCTNLEKVMLPKNATVRITTFGSGVTIYFTGSENEWLSKYGSHSSKQDFEYGSISDTHDDSMTKTQFYTMAPIGSMTRTE